MAWLEALPSFVIIAGALSAMGIVMKAVDKFTNNGKVNIEEESVESR